MRRRREPLPGRALRAHAPVFAALGDETRLALVARLSGSALLSISQLARDAPVTRQAITKHLRVLEGAGLVRAVKKGRESLYQLSPAPLEGAKEALDAVSRQWEDALGRLKAFVEEDG